jgi:hypothetical protein
MQVLEVRTDITDAEGDPITHASVWTETLVLTQSWGSDVPGPYPQGIEGFAVEGLVYALTGERLQVYVQPCFEWHSLLPLHTTLLCVLHTHGTMPVLQTLSVQRCATSYK